LTLSTAEEQNKNMSDAVKHIMAGIDRSIQIAIDDGRSCLSVHLTWPNYRELLAAKDITWEPKDTSFSADFRDRPLKKYRFWPLYLQPENNPQNWVQYPSQHGGLTVITIKI
jgi:hypothetical protein